MDGLLKQILIAIVLFLLICVLLAVFVAARLR